MRLRNFIVALASVALIAIAVTGCTSSAPANTNLVPKSATMITEIKIGDIVNDPVIIAAYNGLSKSADKPQTVQDAINQLQDKTGINIQDFSKILVFGNSASIQNSKSAYLGIIAEGTFNEQTFIQNIQTKTGKTLTIADYKGYKLYTITSGSGENLDIVFFSGSTLVIGSDQAVKDCIDVKKGDSKPISGAVLDTFNKLGSTSIRTAASVPPDAEQNMANQVPAGSSFSSLKLPKLDLLGFSINKGVQDVSFALQLHFPDNTSAQDARDTVSGAVSVFKGTASNADLKTILGQVQYNVSDVWLTISLKTTLQNLQGIYNSLNTK